MLGSLSAMSLWMPPEPGWLGKLIEERAYDYYCARARDHLAALGVSKFDLNMLKGATGDMWVGRLAKKYRRSVKRGSAR